MKTVIDCGDDKNFVFLKLFPWRGTEAKGCKKYKERRQGYTFREIFRFFLL